MSSSYKPTKTFIEQSNLRKAKIAGFIYDVNVRKFLFFCAQVNLFLNLLSYNKAGNDDETRANIYDVLLILNNLVFLLDVSLQGFVNENFFLADDIYHLIDLGCSTMGFASASLIPYANSSYEKNNLLLVNAVTGFLRTWVANYIKEYTNPFKIVELNHRADIIVKNRKDLTLDLCYVKNNLIALSYPYPLDDPATEKKNTIDKVASYLNKYHENNYKVYNLCMEKQYNPIHFNNNVERFPIYDYEVPSLTDTLEFFKTLDKEFKSNKKHVKAFHCMAGKGRTGTLLSMYLLYDRTFFNYEDAMRFFAIKRSFGNKDTHFKGVETPSQRRFVKYFEEIMNKYQESLPRKRILNLKKIVLKSLSITNEMKINIDSDNHKDFKEIELTDNKNFEVFEDKSEITVSNCRNLVNEVKMEFKSFSLDVDKNLKFSFIFHTAFVDEDTNKLVLGKSEIDNAERNFVPGDFGVELYFEQMIGV